MCECEEREGTVSLGAVHQWDDCSLSLLPSASPCFAKHQKCYLKVLLWPFPAPRGKLFTWACGTLQFWVQWHTLTVTKKSLYSKDTRLTALNKARQISDPLRMSQEKLSLIIREVQREAALTRPVIPWRAGGKSQCCYNDFLYLFLYVRWGQ